MTTKLHRHQENANNAAKWLEENSLSAPVSLPQIPSASTSAREPIEQPLAEKRATGRKGWVDITKVIKVLCAMEDYMRLRNYRVVDLFRSREVNTDGDDLLSTDELLTVLESMHLNLNKSDLRMVVDYMDADSSGDIDVDELSAAMRWARRNSAPRDAMNQIAAVCRANPASDILMLTTRTAKRKGKAAEEHARMQQRAMQR